jgi:hypothetical protein
MCDNRLTKPHRIEAKNGQMMKLYETRIISGDIRDAWRVATDVARWPEWDPHEEAAEIYGEFCAGTKAYSKPRGGPAAHWALTQVEHERSWSLINKMAIGSLEVENRYEQLPERRIKCEKIMVVRGLILRALFKLHFEAETRKDMHSTWQALEVEIRAGGAPA